MTRKSGRRQAPRVRDESYELRPREASSNHLAILTTVLLSALTITLPFLFAPIPPSTDLPQHIAQIRLAHDAVSGHHPELVISWLAPNTLVYLLLGALSILLPPIWAARIGLWLLALGWAMGAIVLAIKRNRSPASALIVSVLSFQAGLYWGLLNFLLGWPIFIAWLQLTTQPTSSTGHWRRVLAFSGVALALYQAHVLWFAFGGVWLIAAGFLTPHKPREQLRHLVSLIPGALLAMRSYPRFSSSRALFQTEAIWTTAPWQRLAPMRLFEEILGGRAGPWPVAIGASLVLWVLAVLITRWGEVRQHSDRIILAAAGLLSLVAVFAPDKDMNTIFFAQRWAPCAVALFVVGLPAPKRALGSALAIGLVSTACMSTCVAWRSFSRVEMTGFEAALDATPADVRILGLDAIKSSAFVGNGRPFMQMMAYLQAEKGGMLSFSFADHGSELVSYQPPRHLDWTPGLEWQPELTQKQDILQFDVVLVNGTPETHRAFQETFPVVPCTTEGRWRLYSVRRTDFEK